MARSLSKERIKVVFDDEIIKTIQECFDAFIIAKEVSNIEAVSIRNYKQSFEKFVKFAEIDVKASITTITEETVNNFIIAVRKQGLADTTINHYLRDIKAFLKWCMEKEYLPIFKITLTKEREAPLKLFSEEEVELLIDKPSIRESFTQWREWAIVCFILATGARTNTVLNVKLGDIDWKAGQIRFLHTKNGKIQYLPISYQLGQVLQEYTKRCRNGCGDEDWLFPAIDNEQLTGNALRHSFTKYCKSRGVARHNLHGLRHTFARNYIISGGNSMKLQQILGHQTITMTEHYVTLFADDLKQDINRHSLLDKVKQEKHRVKKVTLIRD